MRQIVLDTETTGLYPAAGHRVIEIGCVELVHRRLTGRTFHHYLQPDFKIDEKATEVHGITDAFLIGKPRFSEIAQDFKDFIQGAELIIHNAAFDVGFLENEFKLLKDKAWTTLTTHCTVTDTLLFARKKHPGQRNNLDALCKRYNINNEHREKHGALLDAEILADVYLAMTGGQNSLVLEEVVQPQKDQIAHTENEHMNFAENIIKVIKATDEELALHAQFIQKIEKKGIKTLFTD